jgi:RNA polymerase sigma-B factor
MSSAYAQHHASRRSAPRVALADGADRARRTDEIVSRLSAASGGCVEELTRELIEANVAVARSVASRFRRRGMDVDDLEQVALMGLVKAARRYDPTSGHDFLSYAVPTMRGELRRHFRDTGWMVRPPRRIQELRAEISRTLADLERDLGRSARPSEVADRLGAPLADVVEALAADGCYHATSLDLEVGDGSGTVADLIGGEDPELAAADLRLVLRPALRVLSPRDQRIVRLRFRDGLTQQEIATEIGITQAQVSRVLTRALVTLRGELEGGVEGVVDTQPDSAA